MLLVNLSKAPLTPYLQQRVLYPPLISPKPSLNLGIVVVIPAYKEPYLLLSLMSLKRCHLPQSDIEVIVVINDAEGESKEIKEQNIALLEQATRWSQSNSTPRLRFRILYKDDLPNKFAGVGLARKIGMDEACYRFEKINQSNGIIVCFDADSLCEKNYFQAIEAHFNKHPKIAACSIHFEHSLFGAEFEPAIYQAITDYELHLRYFINAQAWAGAPYAFQTIGSAMAIRSNYYQQQGGMNRRKAGEDFYFLHKFISLGKCNNLIATTVIPSPRISDRVPFGTGKAIGDILANDGMYQTYPPTIFKDLKELFGNIQAFYTSATNWESLLSSDCLKAYLLSQAFEEKIIELKSNTSNLASFTKRFFQWFNAFQLMKFANFARAEYYGTVPVGEAATWLLARLGEESVFQDNKELLMAYRELDKSEISKK